jgi:DNA-directed RNA polymerase subunit E'/Rpb7
MEQIAIFEEKVALTPADLSREITSFDEILLERLKKTLEGKCSRHGFVIPGSLELLSRSMGSAEKGRFTADFLYYLKAQGKVYNPPDGFQIEGEVIRKNKMGVYVIIENAVRIMIPRDLHIGNEEFDSIQIGDIIRAEIKKSRFQVNDTHILSIGQYLSTVRGSVGLSDEGSNALAMVEAAEAAEAEAAANAQAAEGDDDADAADANATDFATDANATAFATAGDAED